MKKLREEDYGFSCGVIRSDEGRILSKKDLDKIMEAGNLSQALGILGELGYEGIKEETRDFEKVLKKEEERVRNLIESSLLDKEPMDIVYLPKDYQNIKVILKAREKDIPCENLLVEGGTISKDKILEIMTEKRWSSLPEKMREGLEETVNLFSKGKSPKDIDLILDRTCFLHMLSLAKETGNDFLKDYVRLLIDLTNIEIYVRLKEIGGDDIYLSKALIPEGNLEISLFKTMFEEDYSKMTEKLFKHGLPHLMDIATEKVRLGGSYLELEKEIDNIKMNFLRRARYVSVGIEPIISYYLAKEREITNVRIILTGIEARLPKESIAERMREPYV